MDKKVAILGSTGMLGYAVEKEFQGAGFNLIKTTRNIFNAKNCNIQDIVKILAGCNYAINCIGIIKPYINDNNSYDVLSAIEVNSLFPHKLTQASKITGTKIIQIATDCVYKGVKGNYVETDPHNPEDVYGKTKSLGEVTDENVLNLRCSIIGREKKTFLSLLEWFLHQSEGAKLKGFKNHLWNGVTTNAFAKICRGIIENNVFKPGLQHIIPADSLSKAQMLHIFKEVFNRSDIEIEDIDTGIATDRTLATIYQKKNEYLWQIAGYKKIPTVRKMIEDLVC